MANLHFAVATPNYKVLEHFNDFADSWVHELVDHSPRIDPADGCFRAPDRPGLGLSLNHDACAKHPRTGGRIKLFEQGWEKRWFRREEAHCVAVVEVALDIRAELGEGPIWDDRRQRLLFVDIMRGHVHEFDPAAGTDRLVEFPWAVGAVALHENGDWVLAANGLAPPIRRQVRPGSLPQSRRIDPATG